MCVFPGDAALPEASLYVCVRERERERESDTHYYYTQAAGSTASPGNSGVRERVCVRESV
jgi:hypothetical protein